MIESLKYFPVHQPAATNFMHLQSTYTPHLQHLSNQKPMWNPVKHLRWCFFCGISQSLRAVGCFRKRASSWMFDRILTAILLINLSNLTEALRRSFLPLGLHKGILDSPCLLILLIYTKQQDEILNWPRVLISLSNTRKKN